MNSVIVTDVRYRMSLAIIRSLGKKGIPVTAVEYDTTPYKSALGFFSRYTRKKEFLPGAPYENTAFINKIINLASVSTDSQFVKPVLIPVGLDSLTAVSKHKDVLEPYLSFIVPSPESIEIANDTGKLLEIAACKGIPCPETTTLYENETIEELAARLAYPVVIKYREGEILKFKPEKRYSIVKSPDRFIKVFEEMHSIQSCPIVQKYINGSGYGVSVVFDKNSDPLEIFCHKRLREYPVTGGPSCLCESIWNDRLVSYAVTLLKALKWQGVAMVEFKGDPEGDIRLMEINPRFWGSLPLSVAAKCDIPYAYYRASMGEKAETRLYEWHPSRYKLGKKMRFLFQDIMSLPGYLKLSSNKLRFLASFVLQLLNPRISDGVLELRDWRPSFYYVMQLLRKGKRKKQ
ncbi:MAG: ATP-grasp domain-containing protein [Clostridia bacterium]|nr:ATP-grasp domain-containing protein [Clostridia bacterium]